MSISGFFFYRSIALVVILLRAGLGLDPRALKKLSFTVVRLAFLPCIFETAAVGLAAHYLLDFPWIWGFMLGYVSNKRVSELCIILTVSIF